MKEMIHIFYHAWLVNDWKILMKEQIELLCSTGLFAKCEKLNIGIVSTKLQLDEFNSFIKTFNINQDKIEIRHTEENTYEYITINWLKEFCDNNDALVFY